MEKLELKHLAPYLPYGLKGLGKYPNGDDNIREINISNVMAYVDNDINSKPILRPLSDLTNYKGIFHNWEYIINTELSCDITWYEWEALFEHHFDVFGLIEKGLAIDKNTLDK